ncbi:MAG: tetratricopeptide repeat protein [Pseudomonadota bacterium]
MAIVPTPAISQEMISREVVQPLRSEEAQDLSTALKQLARRPRDLGALVAAGRASLAVDDLEAAMGFFGRAQDLAPTDPRVKLGMARVFLRSGRPVPALALLDEVAETEPATPQLPRDRGLAYDLVGDQVNAQAQYRQALAADPADELTRRQLALSQAIAGDAAGFEETLRPLLEKSDPAAFRARAFGLAIMGEQTRAAAIVSEVMPRDLASRIVPYLAYMPRLTDAQQAAAANLGIFPRAADIGRENPAIAAYASGDFGQTNGSEAIAGADSRLAPAGEPLGASSPTAPDQSPAPDQLPAAVDQATRASVADAFSELAADSPAPSVTRGQAVDLAAINIPREVRTEQSASAKPEHPARIWVQLATGRDLKALGFDWRRFARQAPEALGDQTAHTVPWGQANRLLAGPFSNRSEALRMVNELKTRGLDSFIYSSPEGEKIGLLD